MKPTNKYINSQLNCDNMRRNPSSMHVFYTTVFVGSDVHNVQSRLCVCSQLSMNCVTEVQTSFNQGC